MELEADTPSFDDAADLEQGVTLIGDLAKWEHVMQVDGAPPLEEIIPLHGPPLSRRTR